MPLSTSAAVLSFALAVSSGELPDVNQPVPLGEQTLTTQVRENAERLDAEVAAWRRSGELDGPAPEEVFMPATFEAKAVSALAKRPALSRSVLRRLPAHVARRMAPEIRALRDLEKLHGISQRKPGPPPKVRIGEPEPPATLLRHYRDAQRRFGVGWHVLAAVNHVETKFGRYRNESVSGARGPMQFMPATWKAYGLGGDVRDPRDAIMGAANYLRASGAPRSYRRALYAYNPSSLYVRTVRMYANRIARSRDAFLALYAREVYIDPE